ncbi:MAG TPA: class I SAM-dependent methyltransferase [Chitinophagaceae bacterium]|nr:class I SAM-dependent methyltransferase [Chitinophagaceae bacterium]
MDRVHLIQLLIKQKKLTHYMEIGVSNGHAFFRIKAKVKIAVDPYFKFNTGRKLIKTFLNPHNLYNTWFEKTSDDFFKYDAPRIFEKNKIDIVLIDGMHEYDFATRDVDNALHYLRDDGIIIMHDCNPPTREAACSFQEWKSGNYTSDWNGDVWKTIVFMRSQRKDIDAFVLNCDQGLGIITKRKPRQTLTLSVPDIARSDFADLDANRQEWLDLRPVHYLYEYFNLPPP